MKKAVGKGPANVKRAIGKAASTATAKKKAARTAAPNATAKKNVVRTTASKAAERKSAQRTPAKKAATKPAGKISPRRQATRKPVAGSRPPTQATAKPATALLPGAFADLEPFVAMWALPTTDARFRQRLNSTPDDRVSFYKAMAPRGGAALEYLDSKPWNPDHMSVPDRNLMRLMLSLAEVSLTEEINGQTVEAVHAQSNKFMVYSKEIDRL
jgi:hypothetical protein